MRKFLCAMFAMTLVCGLGSAVRAAEDAPDPKAVLDKAIKALGGEEALGKVKQASWKSKATTTFGNNTNEGTGQTTFQGIDHIRQEFDGEFNGNKFKFITAVSGEKGFRDIGGNRTDLEKEALINAKRTLYLNVIPVILLPLKDKDFKLESIDEQKIADKPAVGIKVTGPEKKDFSIYFDKESGLPVKVVAKVPGFQGNEFTQETTFSEYKDMGGIKKATKIVSLRDGMKFQEQQITEFKLLDKVDPKTFTETEL